jgi:acetolactate synthase small subunit
VSLATIRARLHDRPGALERAIALLRRRAFAIRRLSVAHGDRFIDLVLRIDDVRTPPERVRAELLNLHDVIAVDGIGAQPAPTRELLLAWMRPATATPSNGRVLSRSADGILIEITGSPEELDDVLDQLDTLGGVVEVVRSGEVALPGSKAPE